MAIYSPAQHCASDRYIPAITSIIANHFKIDPSSIRNTNRTQLDYEGIDLLLPDDSAIGLRVRTPKELRRKSDGEFTLRYSEEGRIAKGLLKYYFYSFAKDEANLDTWYLLSCAPIKISIDNAFAFTSQTRQYNADGSAFRAFKLGGFLSDPPLILDTNDTTRWGNMDHLKRKGA